MTIKRKGNQTREKILKVAKEAFYENGYDKTQLQKIAESSNLTLGNLNYYFKKKDDLVKAIYELFFIEIYELIENSGISNELEKFCCFQHIVYTIVLSDHNNKRFYQEIIHNKSNYRVMHELMSQKYEGILNAFMIDFSDLDFGIIILTEFGARREIFLNYFDGSVSLTLDQLVYYLLKSTCKNLGISNMIFHETFECSQKLIKQIDFLKIKFLF